MFRLENALAFAGGAVVKLHTPVFLRCKNFRQNSCIFIDKIEVAVSVKLFVMGKVIASFIFNPATQAFPPSHLGNE